MTKLSVKIIRDHSYYIQYTHIQIFENELQNTGREIRLLVINKLEYGSYNTESNMA